MNNISVAGSSFPELLPATKSANKLTGE